MDDLPTYSSQKIKFTNGCANLANYGIYGILRITSRNHSYAKLLIDKIKVFLPASCGCGCRTAGPNCHGNLRRSSPVSPILSYAKDLWCDTQDVSQKLPGRRCGPKEVSGFCAPPPPPTAECQLSDNSNPPKAIQRNLVGAKEID